MVKSRLEVSALYPYRIQEENIQDEKVVLIRARESDLSPSLRVTVVKRKRLDRNQDNVELN